MRALARAPGSREVRWVHLLGGAVEVGVVAASEPWRSAEGLEERVRELEERVAALEARLGSSGELFEMRICDCGTFFGN